MILGIVNVTPDSFSDGGQYLDHAAAIARARQLVADGADILDIGGESTRPGSLSVTVEEELRRVVPVISAICADRSIPVSVDTSKSAVARAALEAGASIINDVTGLEGDADMPAVVADARAGAIVMHMHGTPQTMQLDPQYPDGVVPTVERYLHSRLQDLAGRGIDPEQVAVDPGIGFGKRGEHNWELLARLREFGMLGRPICLGVSRKGLLGKLVDRPVSERDWASLAVACFALADCGPLILRVHNVVATRDAVRVFERLRM